MQTGLLEHVNFTVSNSEKTAGILCSLFGWKIRWSGPALGGGTTFHVGTDDSYVALYTPLTTVVSSTPTYGFQGGLNHIGIVVADLDAAEARVKEAGYKPHNHSDYEPGKRFYFDDNNGVEFEVVSYA
ncbi:MAG: VOC family protein [Kordiimonadaceae bacterium]|nr:VOC family protein [Kordiimonadaceae bacterium]